MIVKPVFDEMRDFWGKQGCGYVEYSSMPEQDLEWWSLKLADILRFSQTMLRDIEGMGLDSEQRVPGEALGGLNCGEAISKLKVKCEASQSALTHVRKCLALEH